MNHETDLTNLIKYYTRQPLSEILKGSGLRTATCICDFHVCAVLQDQIHSLSH